MDEKEYEVLIEKEKTKQQLIYSGFWILFWFIILAGCAIDVL